MEIKRRYPTLAILLLALTGSYAYMIIEIPVRRAVSAPGPTFMPWVLVILLVVLSALLALKALRAGEAEANEQAIAKDQLKGLLTFGGLLVGYGLAMRYLGFEVPTLAFLFVTGRLLGGGVWWSSLFWAAVLTGAIYVVFTVVFSVPLPRPPWR